MNRLLMILTWLSLPLSLNVLAISPEQKAMDIAIESDKRDSGWIDQEASLRMILRNRQGQESRRELRTRSLEMENDGDKSISIFDIPKDVKNTAFLSFTHSIEADDQWLYLPALKRVKRISSKNKSGPFMGSEFAYEDITSSEVEKYSYKWIKDDVYDGNATFVIERYPSYKYSGYTKQIVYIDKEMYQPWKIEFYDRKNILLKSLTYHDYKKYSGQFWRAHRMEMINHQTRKATTLLWAKFKFNNGFTERDFNRNSLKRIR